MRLSDRLPAALFGTAIVIVMPLIATALTSAEIYPIAEQITVHT
jgi:multisubunit Na+/H+ antiporter MnhC subunit